MSVLTEELLRLVGGDRALLAELCAVFERESTQSLAAISAAISGDDREGVRDAAHRLRGSLGSMCASAAAAIARAIEEHHTAPVNDLAAKCDGLHAEVSAVLTVLAELQRGRT